jgi:hypothetical protein
MPQPLSSNVLALAACSVLFFAGLPWVVPFWAAVIQPNTHIFPQVTMITT